MADVYGIDLGTTYSAIAKLNNLGSPEIIPDNFSGKDTLASAVYFDKDDDSVVVGEEAKESGATEPERLMQFFKRWIGRGDDPKRVHYKVAGKEYDPIDLSKIVLEKIVKYAKKSGEDVKDVVITCPAYFNLAQRSATRKAGEEAGLNVMCIVNEPTAAAINYFYQKFDEDKTALVYDLGGGTFDVTVLKMSYKDGVRDVDVLATDGSAFLGGCDWDKVLNNIFCHKYIKNCNVKSIPEDLKAEISSHVEASKIKLTNNESVTLKIPYGGESIELKVTREEFEEETLNLVDQTVSWLDSALQKANCTDNDIDVVLMVGGSTRMPMIQKMLNDRYGDKVQFSDPDKAVAKGAAIIADMKKKEENAELLRKIQQQFDNGEIKIVHDPNKETTKIVDKKTGEADEKQSCKLEELMKDNDINPVDLKTEDDVISSIASIQKNNIVTTMNIRDVAPCSFGIIVIEDVNIPSYICDNIVKKDEKTPCSYERTYYVPADNLERLSFPVVESISENDIDPVKRNETTRKFTFPDSSLGMKISHQLILDIPAGVPKGSEILVEFQLDELANIELKATEMTTGNHNEAKFSYYDHRVYAVGD